METKIRTQRRKAETLSEAVVSIAVFGILLLGLTDFMSSQINFSARLYHRDNLINKAQELVAKSSDIFAELRSVNKTFKASDGTLTTNLKHIEKKVVSFDWDIDKKILTLHDVNKTNNSKTYELEFAIP